MWLLPMKDTKLEDTGLSTMDISSIHITFIKFQTLSLGFIKIPIAGQRIGFHLIVVKVKSLSFS